MTLTMPRLIRISLGGTESDVFIQPTLAVYEKADLASVASSMTLELKPPGGGATPGPRPEFYWEEIAEFVYNKQIQEADYN